MAATDFDFGRALFNKMGAFDPRNHNEFSYNCGHDQRGRSYTASQVKQEHAIYSNTLYSLLCAAMLDDNTDESEVALSQCRAQAILKIMEEYIQLVKMFNITKDESTYLFYCQRIRNHRRYLDGQTWQINTLEMMHDLQKARASKK
ncbi:hypothetical protein [Chromobacterium haemolyticum]|uniref:Uncharacterized protein n=1 Tax=Chromobacterium haemolyticum TaxID=394935 RepID=A0A1W0D221_9NEIS|nr:hypothetical protein [Chromobacterium haemolyticum]OQS41008.1 hypothetical protein B0T45_09240 [Chromobacterium haemolyticum]